MAVAGCGERRTELITPARGIAVEATSGPRYLPQIQSGHRRFTKVMIIMQIMTENGDEI